MEVKRNTKRLKARQSEISNTDTKKREKLSGAETSIY
jgi:hypothetical protein